MFSVIIPLYNKEAYIQKAMLSVLNQNFAQFELLVIDNLSTDNSFSKAQAIDDLRIRFFQESRAGVSSARNRGIKEAKFDYLCFLDADDYWLPDHLQNLHALILNYPEAGLYATGYQIVEGNGQIRSRSYSQKNDAQQVILKNYFKELARGDAPIHVDAACLPKHKLPQGDVFKTGIHYGEDSLLWAQIFLRYPVALANVEDVVYVRAAENRSDIPEKLCEEFPVVKEFEALLQSPEAKAYEPDIRALIAKQLFLNLVSCLRLGKRKEARAFAKDARIDYYSSKLKLRFLKVLSWFPGFISKGVLKFMYQNGLIG